MPPRARSLLATLFLAACSSPESSPPGTQPDATITVAMDLATQGVADMSSACALTVPTTAGYKLSYEVDDGGGTLTSRIDTVVQAGAFFSRTATKWSEVVDNGFGPSEVTVYRAVDETSCARAEYDDFESAWFDTVPGPARSGQSGATQISGTSWSYTWAVAPTTVVPAGSYSGCMKITRTAMDGRMIEQVHCAGIGMVLQVETPTPGISVTTRLKSL